MILKNQRVIYLFFQKLFCNFFQKKKTKKIPQNDQQLNARVAEIYQMLSYVQDLGNAIMYNPDIDNNTKCVFLAWYQVKLSSIKEELDEITHIVNGFQVFWGVFFR